MLVFVDENVLEKDYYMESPAFKAVKEYGTVILCQCVLDKVFQCFIKDHDHKQFEDYKEYIDNYLIESGNIYPESYPSLTDEEKLTGLADNVSYLFWKNCLDIYRHYVLEDVHIVTENEDFFARDSKLYTSVSADLAAISANHHSLYFWNGIEQFYEEYLCEYSADVQYRQKLIKEIEQDEKGFAEPIRSAVSELVGKDNSNFSEDSSFVISQIDIDDVEVERITDIQCNVCSADVCVHCCCYADGEEHYLDICCIVGYDLSSKELLKNNLNIFKKIHTCGAII